MGNLIEEVLNLRWNLAIKNGSRKVVSAEAEPSVSSDNWESVKLMQPLGHVVHHRGRVQAAAKPTFRSMWGVFFKKMTGKRVDYLAVEQRVVELNRHIWPILAYRCSGWPTNKAITDAIDAIQTKMVGLLLRVAPWPDEPIGEFLRRRGKSASALISSTFRWSEGQMTRFVNWFRHCQRN